jgi:Calcineurin-like phosphoesterase
MKRAITTFRNPIAAIWQHAIHTALSQKNPGVELNLSSTQPEMMQFNTAFSALQSGQPIPEVDGAGNTIENCAKLAAEYVWAEITRNTAKALDVANELRYGTCDPLWAAALAVFVAWKTSLAPVPYVRYSNLNDFVIPLPDNADLTIGLIADWGTGLDDAKWLLEEVMKKDPDVLIHLGDIYYAGTDEENRQNFLNIINDAAPGVPVYTLSGNHDMYSGGQPYYSLLAQLNTSPALQPYQQKASYFCLRSANWQILAMDTGLHDCDLFTVTSNITFIEPQEATWHIDKLTNAGGRKTILLSHHQLFTAFGGGIGQERSGQPLAYNPELYSVFGPYLSHVALWLWGHEHNFEFFNAYLGLDKGRCVGASAIPSLEAQDPYGLIQNADLQGQSGLPTLASGMLDLSVTADGAYFHNYAILTLRSPGSEFQDSKIEYYELDSCNHGTSILMGGEVIR